MSAMEWIRYIFLLSFVLTNILGQIECSNYDNLRQLSVKKSSLSTSSTLRSNLPSNVSSTLLRLKTSSFPLFLSPSPKPASTNHCQFGGKTYEPDDKWKPNLGSPFGLLPCVLCQCVTLQKKSRTVSRVRCRNIVSHCPKPNCSEPILLPGRCCKICPDNESDEFEDDLAPLMNIDVESLCESWRTVPKIYKKFMKKNRICTNGTSVAAPVSSTSTPLQTPSSTESTSANRQPVTTRIITPSTVSFRNDQFVADEHTNSLQSNQESGIFVSENFYGAAYSSSKHRKCFYDNQVFDDGSLWKSSKDACKMCSCQKGQIKCDTIVCPTPNCLNPITTSGDCCPLCLERDVTVNGTLDNQAQGCFFDGDQKFHLAGSQWHPYIPPFGFDRCSVCTCLPETLSITCKQSITCPALTCSPEEAYRENASDCCKKCPNIIQVKSIDAGDELSDQSLGPRVKSANELVLAGGCIFNERVYPNGDEWHPYVAPFGEMRCVKCHCKNKKIKCGRIKCPSITCSKPIIPEDRCCPVCSDD